jgi:hypothetical protein
MDKKQNIISLLKNFRKKIEEKIIVDKIILFGSQARGDMKEGSDIDFIVVSPDFKGIKSFKRAPLFYILWDHKQDVDIICLTPEEFEKKKKQISIVSEALKEGIVIK